MSLTQINPDQQYSAALHVTCLPFSSSLLSVLRDDPTVDVICEGKFPFSKFCVVAFGRSAQHAKEKINLYAAKRGLLTIKWWQFWRKRDRLMPYTSIVLF